MTPAEIQTIISIILLLASMFLGAKYRKARKKFREFREFIDAIDELWDAYEENPDEVDKKFQQVVEEARDLVEDP